MKRSSEDSTYESDTRSKVLLVERNNVPGGVPLVNSLRVAKHTFEEPMELGENLATANSFMQANACNRLEIIGRQMKNLQELLSDVVNESNLNKELHNAACNFVKKPGHIYHLYERNTGQKYFSMLSPEEWGGCPPHTFLGSYRLEVDQSWTKAGQELNRFEGLNYIKQFLQPSQLRALMDSS